MSTKYTPCKPARLQVAVKFWVPFCALGLVSAMAQAADSTDAPASTAAPTLGTVSVIGQGETRQVQRVDETTVKRYAAGTNPLKTLQSMSGVNFQSGDPLGREEGSQRISLRGFDMHHLGYTLDGVTLGNMSFGNYNGLSISRAVIPENVGSTVVAAGIGSLGTASNSDLGGTIQLTTADPDKEFGGRLSQTLGSYATNRTFLRVDTGEYNGLSAYVSGEKYDADAWKGNDNPQKSDAINAKVVYKFGDNRVSFFHSTSDHEEANLLSLSKGMLERLGYKYTYYTPDWTRAVNAANGIYSGGVKSASEGVYNASSLRYDELDILNGNFSLSDNLVLDTTVYHHHNSGYGNSYYPFTYNTGTTIVPANSLRSTKYGIDRSGFQTSLTWFLGQHEIEGGFWIQSNKNDISRYIYDTTGHSPQNHIVTTNDYAVSATVFDQSYNDLTRQFYLRDTYTLMDDRLKLEFGAKSSVTNTTAVGKAGGYASGSLQASDHFLPQMGATYKLNDQDEVFASYSENMSAFPSGAYSPFSTTQTTVDALNGFHGLKPETSKTVEVGVRRTTQHYIASATAYNTQFDNRLIAIANCTGIVICANGVANVGSVTSRGAEFAFALMPDEHWRWSNSLSYNHSTYNDNYTSNAQTVNVKGKTVVDTPKIMYSSSVDWNWNRWSAGLQGSYMAKRYYTYTNDQSVPAYWLANASMAYDLGAFAGLKDTSVSLNAINLFDKRYISTLNTDASAAADPNGDLQILQVGTPRSAFVTLSTRF
ncbi:TonB-dependent receptor [Pseudomonas sp. MAFF 212408]|uniref:TonB-dependent receptor n=1 Tax=Pseudomonas kitaguniensis TaxID=2607908 RepID=A0A5N7KSG4_9PSED|nr:TonB-dependent receptor [Pseudomonas kitaguniensis]MPR04591.1 TonB-dependent receptor [Pseudomonas kitaguniensis]